MRCCRTAAASLSYSAKSLADRFSCVPSQINYVIETRFTPENGYLVESQRGGGGFIRIIRLLDDRQRTLLEAARAASADG